MIRVLGSVCVWLAMAGPAMAQSGKAMDLWPTDKMVATACAQLAKNYNLTEEQAAYTQALMTARVKEFLDQHESGLSTLLAEAMAAKLAGAELTSEKAQSWAKRANPIIEAAQQAIVGGNEQWRVVLDEEQRKRHDKDLANMDVTFRTMNQTLTRWEKGEFKPGEGDRGLLGSMMAGAPRPKPPEPVVGPDRRGVIRTEQYWETYVKRFIKDYTLDAAQSQSATSILAELQQRAKEYRQSHKDELVKAQEGRQKALAAKPRDGKAVRDAFSELRRLNKPVNDMFQELKDRLDKVPTAEQRKATDQAKGAQQAELESRWEERRKTMEGDKPVPTTKASSQPAVVK